MKIDQEYELVDLEGDVDVLKPHPQNPNKGVDEVVDESIDVNGWYGAVIAQKSTGYVLAGHTRLRAALKKGAKQVPVIWRDVDDETALRILLVDNESARQATMDQDLLGRILDQLGDIRGTGVVGGVGGDVEKAVEEQNGVTAAVDLVEDEEEAESALPDLADIPDDVYTPQYGVMLVVETEEDQAEVYEWLSSHLGVELGGDIPAALVEAKLRVVAV